MPQEKFDSWYIDTTQTVQLISDKPGALGLFHCEEKWMFKHAIPLMDRSWLVQLGKVYFGKIETVKTGKQKREVVVDSAYILNSVYNPNDDIVDGYQKGLMLSYKNELTEEGHWRNY